MGPDSAGILGVFASCQASCVRLLRNDRPLFIVWGIDGNYLSTPF